MVSVMCDRFSLLYSQIRNTDRVHCVIQCAAFSIDDRDSFCCWFVGMDVFTMKFFGAPTANQSNLTTFVKRSAEGFSSWITAIKFIPTLASNTKASLLVYDHNEQFTQKFQKPSLIFQCFSSCLKQKHLSVNY